MEIKVIEPIKNYLKEFNSPVEFNLWYAKNKDEVDKLTTHKLNKMYHIMGYRITKIKGELMLKEYMESQHSKLSIDDIVELKNDLQRKNISLENEMEKIKETVNRLINFINVNFQGTIDVSASV